MSYTDVFGGSTVQPGDVQYRAVALSANIVTVWPPYATTGNQVARIMKVAASAGSLTITLPDARLTSIGQDILFDNSGANTFTVLDSAGGSVATIASSEVKYLYLADNTTAAGTWRVTLFGVGASSPDASQLAGYGLKAISNSINAAPVVSGISSNTVATTSDRAKVFVWTGGSGTLTLPTTVGSTSDFHIEVRNQGTGTLTLTPIGGSLIDGSATVTLSVNESCFVHMGASDWYTVGRGRNTAFNFTRLSYVVDGGTDVLTLTQASNVVQTYTGVLLANQIITLPAVVQVYYVSNATTGAYTLTFGCAGGGTSVAVSSSQAAILFCDGTNIINANTSLAGGITSLLFAAGSVTNPSVAINTTDDGFYSTGTDEIGVSINGIATGKWDSTGYKGLGTGTVNVQAVSSAGTAQMVVDRVAAQTGSFRLRTAGVDRWSYNINNTAESGSNAGSNLELSGYNDAGTLIANSMTIVRSTGVVTFPISGTVLTAPVLGTPASGNLANCTGLPVGSITGVVLGANGGTGIANTSKTITLGGNFATSGAFAATLTLTNTTTVTLPVTGTLATLAGSETLSNKTLTAPVLGTPASGALTNCTSIPVANASGVLLGANGGTGAVNSGCVATLPPGTVSLGYLGIPQNSQSAAYTTVIGDSGKHVLHPSADTTARIFTIAANASVAYPIGTAITFVNQNAAGVVTVSINSDTMRLAGAGTTGSRTLAANGVCTALKVTSTEWIISGTGLS